MDFRILIKILLVIYIISSPIIGSIPIQYYVSHSSFVCIYIVCCLIIGLTYDIVICLLLIVILLIWMYIKTPIYHTHIIPTKNVPVDHIDSESSVIPGSGADSESSSDSESSANLLHDTFEGYDNNKDSFACFESF